MEKDLNYCFTIIELMIVIIIVAIISSFFYGSATKLKDEADFTRYKLFSEKAENILSNNVLGEWPLSEGSGGSVYDKSGNGSTGTITGSTWKTSADCVSDSCLYFNGSSDWVDCGTNSILAPTNALTLMAWVKPITLSNWATVMMRTTIASWIDGYGLAHYQGINDINFYINNYTTCASGTLTLNKWAHLVGTYNQTNIRLYINGQLAGSTNYSTAINNGSTTFGIAKGNGGNYFFNGYIDEVFVYDSEMPASQVSQNYLKGLQRLFSSKQIDAAEYQQRSADFKEYLSQNGL